MPILGMFLVGLSEFGYDSGQVETDCEDPERYQLAQLQVGCTLSLGDRPNAKTRNHGMKVLFCYTVKTPP